MKSKKVFPFGEATPKANADDTNKVKNYNNGG